MNPFQQLVDLAEKPAPAVPGSPALIAECGSRTAAMLHVLDVNGPMSTAALGVVIDRQPKYVAALLKGKRERGEVTFEAGFWSLKRDPLATDKNEVTMAVELLTSLGWTVLAPKGVGR